MNRQTLAGRRTPATTHLLSGLLPGLCALTCGGILFAATQAEAQFGPGGGMRPMGGQGGMGGGGMGGMGGGPPSDKPEGPAEAAPNQPGTDAATDTLPPWPEKEKKSIQFFQLHGYLRGRGFYWHNYNLGHYNDGARTANPFTVPYSELPDSMGTRPSSSSSKRNNDSSIEKGIRTADMRFRLEPVINLAEYIRVQAQLDIFDNLVLGSTPEGFYINGRGGAADGYPTIGTRGQVPQESAINAIQSSIRAKRAWGEVKLPLFELAFGRMPFKWGSGMLFHDGNCNDCDFGTTVDRVMLTVRMWHHFASLSWDWAASGPTSSILVNQQLTGWAYNVDNVDDVNQWTLALGRNDDDDYVQERLRQGRPVFNYGALMMLRTQNWDLTYNPRQPPTTSTSTTTSTGPDTPELYSPTQIQQSLGRRSAWSLTADIWAKLQYKKFTMEVEGAGVFGNIGELGMYDSSAGASQVPTKATLSIQQLGGIMRGNYKFLKDSLIVGLEVGSASGPQNGDPRGELNWRRAQEKARGPIDPLTGLVQLNSSRFTFDPDFHVDMILFRRILGTVYNATYLKPSITYWLIDSFGGQAEFIYSLANRPAAFPGHSINMGAEINLRVMYNNVKEGFACALEYGVLFDLGALSQKQEIWNNIIPVDGTTAQAFQAKVMLKF